MKYICVLSVAVVVAALFACAECDIKNMRTRTGMPAPRLVYSCTVKNEFDSPVEVEVHYTHPFENRLVVDRVVLAHGDEKFFGRREFTTVDQTNFAAVVSKVIVKDVSVPENELVLAKDDFSVYSPTSNYKVNVVAADSPVGFELRHGANL